MSRLSYFLLLGICALSFVKAYNNRVYLVRHGEKPPHARHGLSPKGVERANCLIDVFGPKSPYNIGYILAEKPKGKKRTRPLETVIPLADAIGVTVDTSCGRDDKDCVANAIEEFAKNSTKNVLVCWEHKALRHIMHAIGVPQPPKYPGRRYDLIYTVRQQKLDYQSPISQNCPGLDDRTLYLQLNRFFNVDWTSTSRDLTA